MRSEVSGRRAVWLSHRNFGAWAALLWLVVIGLGLVTSHARASPGPRDALIIYTHDERIPLGNAGRLYAILVRNLLGHFAIKVDISALEATEPARVANADAVFFVGYVPKEKLPLDFVKSILRRERLTVWMGGGIDQVIAADDSGKLGLTYVGVRGFDSPVALGGANPGFFDTVHYKGRPFVKHYHFDKVLGKAIAHPQLAVVSVTDKARAHSVVEISNSQSGARAPFATRSGPFWFFAEVPFPYAGPRDRYLVFVDLLYDMLEVEPDTDEHRALIRLEDVHPLRDASAIDKLSALLWRRRVPFSIGVIPYYRDPHGKARYGVKEAALDDARARDLVAALKRAVARGGSIVQHGTTHQFEQLRNPIGLTGEDCEFWDCVNMRPIPTLESEAVVRERLLRGKTMLERLGLAPFAFQMPHYHGSPLTFRAVRTLYPVIYQQGTYYSNEAGRVGASAPSEAWLGQMFPFVIDQDHYGLRVLPDNIGHLRYLPPVKSVSDILEAADYARTVRGGFASFFFHPYLVEGPNGARAMRDLDRLILELQRRGFKFVAAEELAREARTSTEPRQSR